MRKKFYTAKFDRVFRTVLCNEDDKSLMQEFLSNNPQLDIKGYIKSLMQKEGLIKEIIREEIEKLLQQ